jgi:hypothetical protein
MLKSFAILAVIAMLIMLVLEIVQSWASAASFDYKPIVAVLGIASMLVIGAFGWRKMNKVARWYLIAALFISTFMILIALR